MNKRFGVFFVDEGSVEDYLRSTLSDRECVQKTLAAVRKAKVDVGVNSFRRLTDLALEGEFNQLHLELLKLENQPTSTSAPL